MISARRAALLGLTEPLSAIMIAVLGLWPQEDEDIVWAPPAGEGGGGGKIKYQPRPMAAMSKPRSADESIVAWRHRMKMQAHAVIATVCAFAEGAYS